MVRAGALTCVQGLDADLQAADSTDEGQRRAALAEWIASLGGKAVVEKGKVKSISLATVRIGDAHLAGLAAATGLEKLSLEATERQMKALFH